MALHGGFCTDQARYTIMHWKGKWLKKYWLIVNFVCMQQAQDKNYQGSKKEFKYKQNTGQNVQCSIKTIQRAFNKSLRETRRAFTYN